MNSSNPYRKVVEILSNRFPVTLLKITMDVDMFCENKISEPTYYPPVKYEFDILRREWIPTLTSTEPFWSYEKLPDWVR
jgi:hypothetical protein